MKKLILSLTFFCLLISSCAPTATVPPVAQTPVILATQTLTPSLTPSTTPSPTITPTRTITPLPTIPTFAPTFDTRTIVTATPAPAAMCPKEDLTLKADFYVPSVPTCLATDMCVLSGTNEEILKFLNAGGNINAVAAKLRTAANGKYRDYVVQDLTGDNNPDLMFIDFSVQKRLHIFYCSEGQYKQFSSERDPYGSDWTIWSPLVEDLNLDNIPEVVFFYGLGVSCCKIYTLEWDGTYFQDLSPTGSTGTQPIIKDTNNDGTIEIIGEELAPSYPIGLARTQTIIYAWNGKSFEPSKEEFTMPTFLIQAIYDGDNALTTGDLDKALSFFQMAIENKSLDSWTEARALYEMKKWEARFASNYTPEPTPLPDLTEYPRLAAYAYYRMVILHAYLGQMDAAQIQYNTLQQKFGSDPYARPYVEMATAFWNAYQTSNKMYDGCAAAIEFAAGHPDLLTPLGSDYHGAQSHIYVPADVCPFR